MISVIIPVYNDSEGLESTLESIVNQDFEYNYEIIPVDNNSDDGTPKVIGRFEEEYPEKVRGCVEKEIQSSYAARNTGLEKAEGEIICFLDADMWVEEDYLSDIHRFFTDNSEVDYIGCNVEIVRTNQTAASLFDKMNGFPVKEYIEEKNFAPTCCLSVRKDVFEKEGNFNENLISGGDKTFGKKISRSGIEIRYVGDITVYHPARSNWTEIKNKYFRIGRGWYQKQEIGVEGAEKDRLRFHDIKSIFYPRPWNLGKKSGLGLNQRLKLFAINIVKKSSLFMGYQYERFSK